MSPLSSTSSIASMGNVPQQGSVPILLVDDIPQNLIALEAVLSDPSYRLVVKSSGIEALEAAKEQDFAVILLDVQMPIMDGFETARRLRAQERSHATPIIFVTAHHPTETFAAQGYQSGAVDYLFKPLNVDILRAKVAVFAELYRKTREIQAQAERLRLAELREKEFQLSELKRYSEAKYRGLVEGIRHGLVWSADLKSLELDFISPHVEALTGYSIDQCLGNSQFWFKCLEEEGRAKFQQILREARESQEDVGFDHAFRKRSGSVIWFHTRLRVARKPDRSGSALQELQGLSIEITHLKETEAALKATIAAREEFLSVASHELKTPITPLFLQMQAFIRAIRNRNYDKIPLEKLERMLTNSFSQAEQLLRLIDNLLDVSRISAGRLVLSRERVNLCELVRMTQENFAHQSRAHGCEIGVELPERDVYGNWDRLRIEQVIMNLMTNATKYGEGKPIQISVRDDGDVAELSVRDHGIGISPEDQSRIFDRYERAVSSRHFGGLGLGLYIVKQIVQMHHGRISVKSEPGAGSTFTVRLPVPGFVT